MKTIHRSKHTADYTMIPNKLLRGKHLSFCAKGILCMMLSHAEEWQMDMQDLVDFGFEGRERIRSAVRELEAAGYATRKTMKTSAGNFSGVVWTWRDTPAPQDQRTAPNDGKPSDGNPSHIRILYKLPFSDKKRLREPYMKGSGNELFRGLIEPPNQD